MIKSRFTVRLILMTALFISACSPKSDKPNVILLLTDDQAYGDLACHGNNI